MTLLWGVLTALQIVLLPIDNRLHTLRHFQHSHPTPMASLQGSGGQDMRLYPFGDVGDQEGRAEKLQHEAL